VCDDQDFVTREGPLTCGVLFAPSQEGYMRRLLIVLAVSIAPSIAVAGQGHSGGHGGGMGMGARMSGPVGSWSKGMHHGHFHHRHARFFFVGAPWFASYDDSCWRWANTPWGPQWVWVCDSY
jgi:hypothetical protein